jgi:hypothetical protein
MRTLVEAAEARNVTRFESLDTVMAIGSMSINDLVRLDHNLYFRRGNTHHEYKAQQLDNDIARVEAELEGRFPEVA